MLGPPPTSGTRDSFHRAVHGSRRQEDRGARRRSRKADAKAFDKVWKSIREDGAYVDAGENDNLIVQKLEANQDAVGIFGYSFLEENARQAQGRRRSTASSRPTRPSPAASTRASRPLFVYVKKQHIGVVPGLDKFVAEYVSDKAMAKDGYLARKGLVALPKAEADKIAADAKALKTLTAADVK